MESEFRFWLISLSGQANLKCPPQPPNNFIGLFVWNLSIVDIT